LGEELNPILFYGSCRRKGISKSVTKIDGQDKLKRKSMDEDKKTEFPADPLACPVSSE
jgi:hypothetical protein